MRVGIIGSSSLATALARRLADLGHKVTITNSRDPDELAELTSTAGARPTTVEDLAESSDVVFLAMPFGRYSELPPKPFIGKVVVDATDYYPQQDGPIPQIDEGRTTSSQLIAEHLPGAAVVKAFNTVNLLALGEPEVAGGFVPRPAIPMAGDDPPAKALVAELVVELGYDAVDAGSLADSWKLQPGMPVHGLSANAADVRAKLADTS
jgi:8-hydroxy-5-deazaflavin:NADPH oxidoreductase